METQQRNEIITAAAHRTPPHRAAAFAALRRIIDSDALPSPDDLAILYAYFLPKPPVRAKTPEQWVAKAVAGEDDVRRYLRYLYSDGEYLVASSGARLHGAPTTLPAGFYDTALNPVDVGAKYPNWRKVTPPEETAITITVADLAVDTVGDTHVVNLIGDVCVDLRYLREAANRSQSVTVTGYAGARSAVRLEGPFPGTLAVIAPIRR